MRLEDLDRDRRVDGAAERIYDDLAWLGLDWDEGPVVQSQRIDDYSRALAALVTRELSYPCTCSRREVAASAPHGVAELGPHYPGTCRRGVSRPGRPAAMRFVMPEPRPFRDELHGEINAEEAAGDFVVQRADGTFAYQLAVVVDDAALGVTEVVRGDDLLSSTPRQIALYEALDLPLPRFLHVPLVLGPDGARLSKRHGAPSVGDLRRSGITKEAIVGRIAASLGLAVGEARPVDLVADFDIARIPIAPVAL
jgi:glutamyl-tRNA synthetase